jgi:hypothetical protein
VLPAAFRVSGGGAVPGLARFQMMVRALLSSETVADALVTMVTDSLPLSPPPTTAHTTHTLCHE